MAEAAFAVLPYIDPYAMQTPLSSRAADNLSYQPTTSGISFSHTGPWKKWDPYGFEKYGRL